MERIHQEQPEYEQQHSPELETKPRIFLEIGPWLSPSALRGDRHFTGNDMYIALEKTITGKEQGLDNYDERVGGIYEAITHRPDEDYVAADDVSTTTRNQRLAQEQRPGENIEFIYGDMNNIPLQDESVHEIFAGNVLGQSASGFYAALGELSRVAEDGAQLVIKENTTPHPIESTIGIQGQLFGDFMIDRIVRGDEPEYAQLNQHYGDNMDDIEALKREDRLEFQSGMYYVLLHKVTAEEKAGYAASAAAARRLRRESRR